jgi:autotransporter-associated beta strand protein
MKNSRLFAPLITVLVSSLATSQISAATFTWDGGGNNNDLGNADNWAPNGIAVANDILRWDGVVEGPLSLAYITPQNGLNTNPGISISVTANQTSSLLIDGGASALRLNGSGITIASGAGAFTLGDGSGTSNITVFNGTMGMVNNSANTATLGSDLVFATTFSGNTAFAFSGSGNWLVNANLRSSNNTGANTVTTTGTGILTMSAANTYTGQTTIGNNGGSSILRATVSGALGSGIVFVAGNEGSNRLELSGGITLANALAVNGKGNTLGQSAAVLNVSGNNTLSGTLTVNTGGTHNTVQSDAGLLTFSASTAVTSGASGTRNVLFTGAGDIAVSGAITNGSSSGLVIAKEGSGTLTLSGSNTYTGATTVSAGTLLVNGALGNTAVSVTGGTLGGTGTLASTVSVSGNGSTLSPGASIESLSIGALSMGAGTVFQFEADDASATGADLLVVNGGLSLSGVTLDLSAAKLGAPTWMIGDKISLISYTGPAITSGFTGFDDDASYFFGGNQWLFNYNDIVAGSNFNPEANGTSFVTLTVIPEPSAALLGGLGLLALLRRRRS